METNEPLFSRKTVWFCCIFGVIHFVLTVLVFVASLGVAVNRHVTAGPPSLVADATHGLSSLLLWPMIAAFVAMPSLEYFLPGAFSYVLILVNSALWAVFGWAIVWLFRNLPSKMTLHAP